MKQVLQDLSSGHTTLVDAPSPEVGPNHVLIATTTTLISVGTERMLVDFGRASYLDKARQQPEKVKLVLEKIKTDGLLTTYEAVQSKLAKPIPLGYSNVGVVTRIGDNIKGVSVGDRVVSNGPHADLVRVTNNLCARIPDDVTDEAAAFVVLASIGLQGVRLAKPTIGECFVVIGAGLIGLLTIQILRANGCRVLAIDLNESRLELARLYGASTCNPTLNQDPIATGLAFSRGEGVDGVFITTATKSNDPVSQAARMSRKRGRIILIGVTGLELSRADFYEKELSFQVSCSYGPGRYDPQYEDEGHDYPIGFVRWTEQRNFEAVLDMFSRGLLDVSALITHRFAFEDAVQAYESLSTDKSCLGILLQYTSPLTGRLARQTQLSEPFSDRPTFRTDHPVFAVIGAGNYSSRVLIPAFKKAGAQLHTIATASGLDASIQGKKFSFVQATSDTSGALSNPEVNSIVIATRHDSHAQLVVSGLAARKNIFVEKPLCISHQELLDIQQAYYAEPVDQQAPQLMVGFNRRFAPHIQKIKELLAPIREPKSFIMTINAGAIPQDHWTQDQNVGGGRIIGEACHFIDLMRFLTDAAIVSIQSRKMGGATANGTNEDNASITLGFSDGSFGTILYFANGANSFPKERIEVFVSGRVLQLDNFRTLKGYGWADFKKLNLWRQDKGQNNCAAAFIRAIESGIPAIPVNEIFEVARVTLDVAVQLRSQ